MPIYEYRCESCGHRMEKLQKMSEGVLVDCPECEHPALKRLISASAFRLTGSGWYETDFKKDNQRNLAEPSSKESSGKEYRTFKRYIAGIPHVLNVALHQHFGQFTAKRCAS